MQAAHSPIPSIWPLWRHIHSYLIAIHPEFGQYQHSDLLTHHLRPLIAYQSQSQNLSQFISYFINSLFMRSANPHLDRSYFGGEIFLTPSLQTAVFTHLSSLFWIENNIVFVLHSWHFTMTPIGQKWSAHWNGNICTNWSRLAFRSKHRIFAMPVLFSRWKRIQSCFPEVSHLIYLECLECIFGYLQV